MYRLAPFAVGGLAAALGLYNLGHKELGNAEATSFFIARLDWTDTWTSLSTSEANGSPFYLLLHFWSSLGESEFILRLLPLMFGVATPVLLYFLVARLFSPVFGVAAGALLAVNAYFVLHSQNLRSYSMSAFLATLATYLFVRIVDDKPRWALLGYVPVGALLIYAHFFGSLVLVAHAISLLFLKKDTAPLRSLMTAWASIAVLVVPLALFVLFQDVGQVDWIPELTVRKIFIDLSDLVGVGGYVQLAVYAVLVVGAAVFGARLRRAERASRRSWAVALVVLWFVFPVAIALSISVVKPLWQARYLLISLPALATCAALAIGALRRPALVGVAFVATAGLTASQLPGMYADIYEPAWRDRTAVVLREGTVEDGVVFYAPTVIRPFGYHYGFYLREVAHPKILYPHKGWLGFSRTDYDIPLETILDEASRRERVWLVLGAAKDESRVTEEKTLRDGLAETCGRPNGEWKKLAILLYEDCRTAP